MLFLLPVYRGASALARLPSGTIPWSTGERGGSGSERSGQTRHQASILTSAASTRPISQQPQLREPSSGPRHEQISGFAALL